MQNWEAPIDEVFATFDFEPVAAASIGQAHALCPWLGLLFIFGFIIAALLGIYLAWSILRSRHK